jgi:uncharacterized protein (TIGR03435 family)
MLKPMKRIGLSVLLAAGVVLAQAPAFEVASVRPALTPRLYEKGFFCPLACNGLDGMILDSSRVDISYAGLDELIVAAYRIKPKQLSGPEWMSGQHFEILAKIPDGVPKSQLPEMLQALLAERFKLTVHRGSKEQPVYGLTVAKNGPKLLPETGADLPDTPSRTFSTPQGEFRVYEQFDGPITEMAVIGGAFGPLRMRIGDGGMHMELLKGTMPVLAQVLSGYSDLPVVDMTGLKGNYHVTIDMSRQDMFALFRGLSAPPAGGDQGFSGGDRNPATASDPAGGGLSKVVEKLGLKLERRKAPVEMLVVDHLEKMPTEN